jgi:hypothetical protein
MKKILLFVVVAFCISCNNKKLAPNEYELEVSIAGLADSSLLILQEPKGTIIDSTRLSNNKATFKGSLNEYPVQWVLRDLNGNYKYIWVEPSYMNVTVKDGNFFEAKITGSKIQAESDELARRIKPFEIIMDNVDNYAMKNQENLSDIEIDSLRTIYFRAEKDEELETQKFIEDKVNTYYSIHILDFYKTTFGKKVVSNLFEKFNEEYKNSDYGKSISNYLNLNKEPKKTIEGFIGGVVFAIFAAILISFYNNSLTLIHWIFLALIVSFLGTAGDLIESKYKRNANIKDSGNIMPGHGGILDRLDSLMFAAPFVYLYINFII